MGDLIIQQTITLSESLCGFQRNFKHLDGRTIVLTSPVGNVVKHKDVQIVAGEGMPQYGDPFQKGRLFVIFEVEFPENGVITSAKAKELKKLLPSGPKFVHPGPDSEDVELQEFDPERGDPQPGASMFSGKGASSAYDEDPRGRGGGGGVECANQ